MKVKGKVLSVHAMKAYMGSRGIGPLILHLRTRWRRVRNFTPQLLFSQERTLVQLNRLGWATEPVGTFLEKTYLLSVVRFDPWTIQPVAPCRNGRILKWV